MRERLGREGLGSTLRDGWRGAFGYGRPAVAAMANSLAAITSSGLSGRPSFTMDAIADCRLLSIECSATGKEGVGGLWV